MAVVWFGNLEYRRLFHPDEGRYAEIPREMVATADWITPRLNGIKYFEKPPLQYWATAIAYRAFGASEWTSRLWTALSGFLAVLLVYAAGVRLFGAEAGLYAALILVSSAGFVLGGHFNTLDMGLTFFQTLAVVAFLFAQRYRQTP
ncbi:MAG: glycosyltransferase family 39 protein, partial [Burkholderiales bacterium]|nr:glycosyltransferase family 39 protein [Burkholderiales bacterium]